MYIFIQKIVVELANHYYCIHDVICRIELGLKSYINRKGDTSISHELYMYYHRYMNLIIYLCIHSTIIKKKRVDKSVLLKNKTILNFIFNYNQ